MARLGSFLLRASILVAVGWVWFNYANGYPMNAVSAEAGIMVLIGIALCPHWRAALLKQSDGRLRASSLPSNSAAPSALMMVMPMMVGGHNCMQLELGRRSTQLQLNG
jgi:hypothetical protein